MKPTVYDNSCCLAILEAKLNSVPDLTAPSTVEQTPAPEVAQSSQPASHAEATSEQPEQKTSPPPPPSKTVAEDERFVKYFKMLKMGVPIQAVKNKMKAEGLDDSVLDNPDAPAGDNVVNDDADEDSAGDESDSWD